MVHLPFPQPQQQSQQPQQKQEKQITIQNRQQQQQSSLSNQESNNINTGNSNESTQQQQQQTLVKRPPLDVYKKLPIIRKPTDSVTYEDSEGNLRSIVTKDLFNTTITTSTSTSTTTATITTQKEKTTNIIPTPELTQIQNYDINDPLGNDYILPECYIRHKKKNRKFPLSFKTNATNTTSTNNNKSNNNNISASTSIVLDEADIQYIDYNLDIQDENFIKEYNNNNNNNKEKEDINNIESISRSNNELDNNTLELMIDMLEKATKFEGVMSPQESNELLTTYVPHILPFDNKLLDVVYKYWIQKRSTLKKPLLRQYWPITSNADTNPHAVFRLRKDQTKEKYKLRKKRVLNDVDSYRKMILLKRDFETMKSMLEYVLRREKIMEMKLILQQEWLEQKKYECFDTSGLPRVCSNKTSVNPEEIEALLKLPKANFSSVAVNKTKKKKKKRRLASSSSSSSHHVATVDSSSVLSNESDMYSNASIINNDSTNRNDNTTINASSNLITKDTKSTIPNCMQYLPSRETFVTNWDFAEPFQSNYISGEETSTYRFRHRPRLGRGGRILIDRYPIETHHNTFIAGEGVYHNVKAKNPNKNYGLLDLVSPPAYNDIESVQNKIEDIGYMLDEDDNTTSATTARGAAGASTTTSNVGLMGGNRKEEESGQVVMVKVDDWMNAEDGHWGEEKLVLGPL